jgi:hypothetical protein
MKLFIYLFTDAAVVDDAIKFVSDKSSISIEPELEKHKVDDTVTVDKKHSNDIQRSEEEDKQQQPATNNNKHSLLTNYRTNHTVVAFCSLDISITLCVQKT